MKTLNPIFIIITFFICIVLYSCRTAKPDPFDCNLPKNLEIVIDEISKNPDSTDFMDHSKVISIYSYTIDNREFILVATMGVYGYPEIEKCCLYGDILIQYWNINSNNLIQQRCEDKDVFIKFEHHSKWICDPRFEPKNYILKNGRYKQIFLNQNQDEKLIDLLEKSGLFITPPPPPIE